MPLWTPVGPLLASLLWTACAPEDEAAELRVLLTGGNSGGGTVFNTHVLDEHEFSELVPSLGVPHMGVRLDRVALADEEDLAGLVEDTGELIGVDGFGETRRGAALLGSAWSIGFNMGMVNRTMFLIDAFEADGVPRYRFYHHQGDVEVPNCPDAANEPGSARVLSGLTIDESTGEVSAAPGTLYLACDTGATGKAAELGYYDLARTTGDLGLFETAIRVIRADYCYDGTPHTQAGVELVLEDVWWIHGATEQYFKSPVEAAWGHDGLVCRGKGRLEDIDCLDKKEVPICPEGATFATLPDALFITRIP
ncbi:ADYC domain-containing protein [Nannocystis bainbridge]|uniref:ADYC domain-containing protein n=1 Tax=Nannocystis bainbridge TaxID=2995303 RepID=A0ABT5DSL2_9BACT|nr:ADYC domain-containing protein [Nannocystis bainbridge]MDC0716621.1 ADYC domain-containing protein [Nannocystis bainbridge]